MSSRSLREEELKFRLWWFVNIRWVFLAGLAASIFFAHDLLGVSFSRAGTLTVAAVIGLYNTVFFFGHRRQKARGGRSSGTNRTEAILQTYLDTLALSLLIHFAGGIENPLLFFYLFHAIISSILLSRAEVYAFGLVAFGMFMGVVLLEYHEVLPHVNLRALHPVPRHQDVRFIGTVALVFFVTLFVTIWITTSIVTSLRRREQELVEAWDLLDAKSHELRRANDELLNQQSQLIQSEKLASLGQLVSGIAHEINNPVQFIGGNMQIVRESFDDILPLLDEEAGRNPELTVARLKYPFFRKHAPALLDDMVDGVTRIRDIVRDLRIFARRDEGLLEDDVDLNAVIESSRRLVHNRIKHFRVVEDLDPRLPTFKGSANRIGQVIVNTLINAADALAGSPDPAIEITTRAVTFPPKVWVAIKDNGPGIDEAAQARLFDPFFTTRQRAGGTGLGLSITYGIVQQHGGRIEVDSSQGKGATFRYIFPIGGRAT